MKVIIAGSRHITDPSVVLKAIAESGLVITEVVSGAARGVDQLGERWAAARGIPVRRFPADWRRHGRSAGPLRNLEMIAYADAVVAVWDGVSRGTYHTIQSARGQGLVTHVTVIPPTVTS